MLQINWADVANVLSQVMGQLIGIGVAVVAAIVIIVAAMAIKKKAVKRLVRGEALVAMVVVILVMVNQMCVGPLSTLLTSVAGKPVSTIDEATTAEATDLVVDICREGITLLKDEGGILPLQNTKINVFGWSATNPCYGGTGSGALNDAYPTVTFLQGLENAGIEYNQELIDFYTSYHDNSLPNVSMWNQDWTLPQPGADLYSSELIANAKNYSDTAVIFIARVGGEGADLPKDMTALVNGTYKADSAMNYNDEVNAGKDWDEGDTYLNLTNPEEEMVKLVCDNFSNVIVIYNSANAFELGFIDEYPSIKGAIWCPGTGQAGFTALGEILTGVVNPSGHLIDTFVYDLTATPVFNNIGYMLYDNMDEFAYTSTNFMTKQETTTVPSFVNYVEGIYVGYKFYETAAKEGLIDCDKVVQYPFGYGLSYTTFTQEMGPVSNDGTNLSFDVTVTNTGKVAGKSVVQVYFDPPYTNGGIEKASANLVEFAKTGVLEPGASETVSVTFPVEEMASYDYLNKGCYVLEAGDYTISVNSDSHNVLDSETVKLSEVVYDANNKRASDAEAAVNQFDYVSSEIETLSRKDGFANYDEVTAKPATYSMSDASKALFYNNANYLADDSAAVADENRMFPDAQPITTGANNGLKLIELRGKDYDDPMWEQLLDQLTIEEMGDLIALGGYQTLALDSIEKYRTNDCDGPASINNNFTQQGSVGFPAAVMIAATWNDDLAMAFGESIGKMADQMDTAGWYAPAMNIHRSAFAGRNFEYYSEDPVLSGSIAANAVIGAEKYGVYAYIKHFALNDQETNRCGMLATWCNEQAMREIYLKPFEIAVKEGGADAVMSSFNYVGPRWAGGTYELQTQVLRNEWGFKGMVLTDYFGVYGYMSADQGVRNGTDFCLVNYPTETSQTRFRDSAGSQQAMRQATKNILYVTVNSRQYSELGIQQSTQPNRWETILKTVNIVGVVLLLAWEALLIVNFLKRRKEPLAVEAMATEAAATEETE